MISRMKYAPKLWATITYFLLMAVALLLMQARKSKTLQLDFLNNNFHEFYTHISNFSLSLLLLSIVGYIWLLTGLGIKHITLLTLGVIIINFVYELFIPVLNTPDPIDAWFGVAGCVVGWLFLILVKKFGLKDIPKKEEK